MRDIKQSIEKVMDTFGRISGHGVVFHAAGTGDMHSTGEVCAFCRHALQDTLTRGFCRYACLRSGMQTLSSGEPHYERCWAGLLYVAVSVSPHGVYQGALSSGGFCDEGEVHEMTELVAERLQTIPGLKTDSLLRHIGSVRPISTAALRGLGAFLLESTFSGGVNSSLAFQRRHARYAQQRKIAEALVALRDHSLEPSAVLADTYRIVRFLDRRDYDGAMQFVSHYLARLLLVSRWNLPRLRAYVRVLVAVITSQDILAGLDWSAANGREMLVLARIDKAQDVESVCYEVAECILAHFRRTAEEDARIPLLDKVIGWLQRHYHEKATIQQAAQAVGASVSTISHRLARESGQTFRQLRLTIRLAEAKRLLAETDMEISAIAAACGFTDQSHFTRHFRNEINMTPGYFRRLLQLPLA